MGKKTAGHEGAEDSVELAIPQTNAELEALLFEGPEIEVYQDPVEIQREILRRILSAQTPEQLRRVSQATPWQELEGEWVEVYDFRLRKSNFKAGAAVFAVVDSVVIETGEAVTLTCSGLNVLGTLVQHKRMGWLPWRWRLTKKERQSESGYDVLWLDDVGIDQPITPVAPAS